MAQDTYACLYGSEVSLSGDAGPFRCCRACGSWRGVVRAGSGPHLASLECADCGGHVSWLGRDHLDAMLAREVAQ